MASESLFYKILEDDLRQKILVLIAERGSLSYSDLMEKFDPISERLLNYHLKVLGDLLCKNGAQYVLTERGCVALKFLAEYPLEEVRKRKERKYFWFVLAVIACVFFVNNFILYLRNPVFADFILRAGVILIVILILAYCLYEINPLLSGAEPKKIPGVYIASGGVGGFGIGFFGLMLAGVFSGFFGGPNLFAVIAPDSVHFLSYLCITTVVGCFVGYGIGKKRGFRRPNSVNN